MLYEIYNMLTNNVLKYVNDMQESAKENVPTIDFKSYFNNTNKII